MRHLALIIKPHFLKQGSIRFTLAVSHYFQIVLREISKITLRLSRTADCSQVEWSTRSTISLHFFLSSEQLMEENCQPRGSLSAAKEDMLLLEGCSRFKTIYCKLMKFLFFCHGCSQRFWPRTFPLLTCNGK